MQKSMYIHPSWDFSVVWLLILITGVWRLPGLAVHWQGISRLCCLIVTLRGLDMTEAFNLQMLQHDMCSKVCWAACIAFLGYVSMNLGWICLIALHFKSAFMIPCQDLYHLSQKTL